MEAVERDRSFWTRQPSPFMVRRDQLFSYLASTPLVSLATTHLGNAHFFSPDRARWRGTLQRVGELSKPVSGLPSAQIQTPANRIRGVRRS
jgi:hypothetical protein